MSENREEPPRPDAAGEARDQDRYQVSSKPSAHGPTDATSGTPGDVPGDADHRRGVPDVPDADAPGDR